MENEVIQVHSRIESSLWLIWPTQENAVGRMSNLYDWSEPT